MKDVVDLYLTDERAAPFRKEDLEANEGIMPGKTILHENICFCLIKPTYDQCADPARLLCAPCKRTSPRQSSYLPAWRE